MANTKTEYGFGNDPIVIRKHVDGIKGGVALDFTNFPDEYVRAGHVCIRDTETKKVYKPFPVANGAIGSLPNGYEYCGIIENSVPKDGSEMAAVLTIGEVNDKALPYPITTILAAFKAAVPTIVFNHD